MSSILPLSVSLACGATRACGLRLHTDRATSEQVLNAAFAKISQMQAGPLVVGADSFFITVRNKIVAQAAHFGIPTIYETRESVVAGALKSYTPNFRDAYCRVVVYVGPSLEVRGPPTYQYCNQLSSSL